MNCKPGDLAFVVKAIREKNIGRILKVVRLATEHEKRGINRRFKRGPAWIVDGDYIGRPRDRPGVANDEQLRPIRPGGVTDEEVRDLYAPKQREAA